MHRSTRNERPRAAAAPSRYPAAVDATNTMRAGLGCLLVTLLALAARSAGLGTLLPHAPEEDAYIVRQAELIRAGGEPTDKFDRTVWRKYPHLLARVLAWAPIEPEPLPPLDATTLDRHLSAASRPHHLGRGLVALVSVLAIPLVWFLARCFTSPTAALLPTVLFASALLPHYLSQQARPHGPVGTFTLGCMLAAALWWQRPRTSVALLGGISAALALACLHNGSAGLVPLFVAWLCAWPRSSGRERILAPMLALFGVAVAVHFGYPFLSALLDAGADLGNESVTGHQVDTSGFNGGGFTVAFAALRHNDPLLGVLALIGLVSGVASWRTRTPEQRRAALAIASFAVPYLIAIGMYDRSFERFALPLWPVLALLAALGLRTLAAPLRAIGPGVAAVPLVVVVLFQTALVARKVQFDLRPDTYETAAAFVESELAPGTDELLLVPRAFLPLPLVERSTPFGEQSWSRLYRIPWREHLLAYPPEGEAWTIEPAGTRSQSGRISARVQGGGLNPLWIAAIRDQLRASGARHLVSIRLERKGESGTFEQLMDGWGTLVHSVSPWPGDPDRPADFGYQGESTVERLLLGSCFGPTLRIWELPR